MTTTWDTELLSSIVKTTDISRGYTVESFCLSGEGFQRRIVDAVNSAYPRPENLAETLADLDGKPVTVLRGGSSAFGATSISAWEGKLFKGGTSILPKGKRKNGYKLDADKVLDVIPGYGHVDELQTRLDAVRAKFPQVQELTSERLAELPDETDDGTRPPCTLAVFGRVELPGQPPCLDAVWLIHTYIADADIAEGVLYLRPESGFSEHGSIYGKQLQDFGGEILNFAEVTLADALDLIDVDHDEVLQRIGRQ